MKYKFQEGDRVRVVDHLKQGNDFLVYCNEDMEVWAGYDAVIRERTRNYNGTILGYHIFIEHPQFTGMNKAWIYTEDMLEEVVVNNNDELFEIDIAGLIGGIT